MSSEIYLTAGIGFQFTTNVIDNVFGTIEPERFHLEDRWDTYTGKPIEQEKVIDSEESFTYHIHSCIFEDMDSFLTEMCGEEWDWFYDVNGHRVIFLIKKCMYEEESSSWQDGNISYDGDYIITHPENIASDIEDLRKFLEDKGLEPSVPKLFNLCQISS